MPAGFGVEPGAVAAGGDVACELAEALRSVRTSWNTEARNGRGACGFDLVQEAYTTMLDGWFDEIGVHIRILEELGEAVRQAAVRYSEQDENTAKNLSVFRSRD